MKTYAIGDIHGMLDYLLKVLAWIEQDAGNQPSRVIFLGDYIDRGPDSDKVVELLIAGPQKPNFEWICLKGNHEDMLFDAVHRSYTDARRMWLTNGGLACLKSYQGIKLKTGDQDWTDYLWYQEQETPWLNARFQSHLSWLEALPLTARDTKRIFVHAGLRPGLALAEQSKYDMLWIRDEFLYAQSTNFGGLVVHGHSVELGTPVYKPGFRLNLDTGSCFDRKTAFLTVAAWEGDEDHPRVFQVGQAQTRVLEWSEDFACWVLPEGQRLIPRANVG